MTTATDRLAHPADNRVEVERIDDSTGAARVRYLNSGTVSTIHRDHLIFDPAPAPAPKPAPRRVVIEFVRPGGTVRHARELLHGDRAGCVGCGAEYDLDARVIANTLSNVANYRRCAGRRRVGI